MLKKLSIPLIALILVFSSCDSEKFLNYNFDAELQVKTATVSGKITNTFDARDVRGAEVQIGSQTTYTDSLGNFKLTYLLTEDNQVGAPVEIIIKARNYYDLTLTREIFESDNIELNLKMIYGAPIIEQVSLANYEVCQAVILDYQGPDDIVSVIGHFEYRNASNTVTLKYDQALFLKGFSFDGTRAHFQASVQRTGLADGELGGLFSVTARDKDGFEHTLIHFNDPRRPDSFLFDPD